MISRTLAAMVAISLGAFLLGLFFWNVTKTDPMWAIVSFVLVYDPDMRAALSVGLARLWHTVLGTGIALGVIYACGLERWVMPLSLAIAALVCGFGLRFKNSWRVVMVTVALVIGASLWEPAQGTHIALYRALEVFGGSLLAIGFSWVVAKVVD